MTFSDSDRFYIVYKEDIVSLNSLARCFKCKVEDIANEYDKILDSGEYYSYQQRKFKKRGLKKNESNNPDEAPKP